MSLVEQQNLSNMEHMILRYSKCGLLIRFANNKQKYCYECAREVNLYQNRLWKREYDKSRKIENH